MSSVPVTQLIYYNNFFVIGEFLIFDFLAYKHVLRPQEAKKPVFKKSMYVCVCVYVHTYVTGDISDSVWY